MPVRLRHPGKTAQQLAHYRQRLEAARAAGELGVGATLERQVGRLEGMLKAADRCRHCGRPLEDPVSIARGIGSTCWARGAR